MIQPLDISKISVNLQPTMGVADLTKSISNAKNLNRVLIYTLIGVVVVATILLVVQENRKNNLIYLLKQDLKK